MSNAKNPEKGADEALETEKKAATKQAVDSRAQANAADVKPTAPAADTVNREDADTVRAEQIEADEKAVQIKPEVLTAAREDEGSTGQPRDKASAAAEHANSAGVESDDPLMAKGTPTQPTPGTAQLEAPPIADQPILPPTVPTAVTVGIDLAGDKQQGRITVAGTDEAPSVDGLFVAVGAGNARRLTQRLSQDTYFGPHSQPSKRLVLPAGAVITEAAAARLTALIKSQNPEAPEGTEGD